MKMIFRYLKPFYAIMGVGLAIKIIGTLVELLLPYILSHILDDVVPQASVGAILWWGSIMIACAVVAWVANVKANRMASKVARDASEQIRHDLFEKTLHLSARASDEFTIPSLEARLTTDTYNVHHFIGMMQRLGVRAPMLLIGGLAITAVLDRNLTLVMAAVLPLIALSVWLISSRGIPLYTKVQKKVDGMVRVVREDAQGIRVIKALSREEHEKKRFETVNKELSATEKHAGIIMAASNPSMNLFLNLGLTAVILVGALLITNGGQTKPGVIIAFLQYFTLLSNAMLSITRIFVMYSKSAASARRIEEVLQCPETIVTESETRYPSQADGKEAFLCFDHVDFSYNGKENNLSSFSFSLPEGGTLGIIGATGSGKTTVLQLLLRFYDISAGSIRIGGHDIRTIPPDELYAMFGVTLQNDFLYADTVEENIRFGRDISEEQIVRAARTAQALDFIEAFPEGFSHKLTAKGTNISGGQKQRLLIARALAGEPKILILDDSSSALDYKTDANLRQALRTEYPSGTRIVIAQRVSAVRNCDLILVLDDGAILGAGTHDQLILSCPVYREISESQMGGELLD